MMYLGDYLEDSTIYFKWNSNSAAGASITRAVDGTISVYQDASLVQRAGAEITDVEDFDGLTGLHHCTIDTSAHAFYTAGHDYMVVLSAATIDGQVVNAMLAQFSIANRHPTHSVLPLGASVTVPTFTITGGTIQHLDFAQLSTVTLTYVVTNAAGTPLNIVGDTLRFTCFDKNETMIFQHDNALALGLVLTDPANGEFTVAIDATDTANPMTMRYELWNDTDDDLYATGRLVVKDAYGPDV